MIRYREQALRDNALFESQFPGSPIGTIPYELLAEIFRLCICPEDKPIAPQWWLNMSYMVPWRLMRVCRRWRDIAVQTPALWSRIIYKTNFNAPRHIVQRTFRRMLATLETMLQRSGDTPLCLQLDLFLLPKGAKESCPQWSRILEQLFLHSRRWKAIRFPGCDDILELLESVKDLKLLEVVELETYSTRDCDRRYSILSGCQNLRHLTLDEYSAYCIAIPQVPWMNIVCYDSAGRLDKHHLRLIGSMPRLARLQIRGFSMVTGIMRPTAETIICKELKQLYITHGEPEVQGLILPNLQKMTCYDMQRCSGSIVPMLIQSGYPLKQLTISSHVKPLHTDLCALLEAAPSLTSLALFDWCKDGWTEPLIERLALTEPPEKRVCTQLRYLFVRPHPEQRSPSFTEALSAALDARRNNPSSSEKAGFIALERVDIQLYNFPGVKFMASARSLLDNKVVRIQSPAAGRKKHLMRR